MDKTDSDEPFKVKKGVKSGVVYDPGLQRIEKRLMKRYLKQIYCSKKGEDNRRRLITNRVASRTKGERFHSKCCEDSYLRWHRRRNLELKQSVQNKDRLHNCCPTTRSGK